MMLLPLSHEFDWDVENADTLYDALNTDYMKLHNEVLALEKSLDEVEDTMAHPMGLAVDEMVTKNMNGKCSECIQCGACADVCPKGVIRYSLKNMTADKK